MYCIKNWEQFEKADNRKCVTLMRWVAIPTGTDDKWFKRLMERDRKVEIYSAAVALIRLSSRNAPEKRGTLSDKDGPLSIDDIACLTGFPKELYDMAIPILLKIGLLEERNVQCDEQE